MAQIDLRNATIKIKDGYAGPAGPGFLVNNAAGYSAGAVTMAVDTGTGVILTHSWFIVGGELPAGTLHRVTAHVETLGATTSITFTPALVSAVVDNAIITIQPNQIEVKIGDGNMTYSEKRNIKYIKDRGRLSTVKQEDDEPVEVKIDAIWEFIKASTGQIPTIEDALKKRGEAAAWVTSATDTCEPHAVDLEIIYTPPCAGELKERVTLLDFRYEQFEHDLRQGMFSVSGKCNITEAAVVREA